jgi:hypothetical protein
MDDLARGWAIVWPHMHADWAVWIAILVAIMLPVWGARQQQKKNEKAEVQDFRPIKRTLIQGSEKDYRRPPSP